MKHQQQHNKGTRSRSVSSKCLFAVVLLVVTCAGLYFQYTLRCEAPPREMNSVLNMSDHAIRIHWDDERTRLAGSEKEKKKTCGASRVRDLPAEEFCRHGFILGRATEAGFGNEMYKILNAAALSIMLNRSLIIVQIRDKYPFADYISYSNQAFNLTELKHLWRLNGCIKNYRTHLILRSDNFLNPSKTNVLCSNWRTWQQPVIRFESTTDAMASQFFLKNIHPEMRDAASDLFGQTEELQSRPNVFGELMKFLISPSEQVKEAVDMVLHFDYKKFGRSIPRDGESLHNMHSKANDWGPAPRWVAFVDFFLAARAKHAVVSGANSRVGTTYAQLIAAFAAANQLAELNQQRDPRFSFMSSFQSNLLKKGLRVQSGWGHVWSRFAGSLSCENQSNQCAFTPLIAPAWWDGSWQSPVPRDMNKLSMYGVRLSDLGTIDEDELRSYCASRNATVMTSRLI
ncbi:hypothetical protein LINPERHAP2_LOCUS10130 [Linum perenne]